MQYEMINLFISNMVGLQSKSLHIKNVMERWICVNMAFILFPLIAFQQYQKYITLIVLIIFFCCMMPLAIKRWFKCHSYIVNDKSLIDTERVRVLSIMRFALILIIWPITGIVITYYLTSDLMAVHFSVTTLIYLVLIIKYKNYLTSLLVDQKNNKVLNKN